MNPVVCDAITVKHISHSYDGKDVLSNVSFSVGQGEFFVILGPNGSGKSTLMRLLAGVEKKMKWEEGKGISLWGIPLEQYSRQERAKIIAFVPQSLSVEFPVTIRELVMSGRAPHQGILGLEHDEDVIMVESAMAYTDISHLSHRALNSLSGGERQRVYIAAAICQEPSVILLDEPTSALDLNHQMRVMDLMERLKRERQMTVVMILHDINLAAMVADKILILKQGNVFTQGPATDVLTREILEDVYECRLMVDRHPLSGRPRISSVPEKYAHYLSVNRKRFV